MGLRIASNWRHWLRTAFGIPFVAALTVGVIGMYVAWQGTAGQYIHEHYTRFGNYLNIDNRISQFTINHGRLPMLLDELQVPMDYFNDRWGNPILYRPEGNYWMLTSLGRDGKRGGFGLDADYTYRATQPEELRPTLEQFLGESEFTHMMIAPLLAAMVLWTALIIASNRKRGGRPVGTIDLMISAIVLGVLAIFCGYFLAALHIPMNNH